MPIPIEPQGNEYLAQNVARMKNRRAQRGGILGGTNDFLDVVDEMGQRDREIGTDVGGGGMSAVPQQDRGTPVLMASMGDGGGARAPSVAGSMLGGGGGGPQIIQTGLLGNRFSQNRGGGGTVSRNCRDGNCSVATGGQAARPAAQESPAQTQTAAATPAPATSFLPAIPESFSPEARAALGNLQTAIQTGQQQINQGSTTIQGAAQLAPLIGQVSAATATFHRIFESAYASSTPEAKQIVAQGIEHRDLINRTNALGGQEMAFGAFSRKAEHEAAILGRGTYQVGDQTIDYFGMTIDQRAAAIADVNLQTVGTKLPETERLKFYNAAKEDAVGTITAYDIAHRLATMEAGNPDMSEADSSKNPEDILRGRITKDTKFEEDTGLPDNVQRATLDAAIEHYSGMKDADGKALTGDALRAKIVMHLGGNLATFLAGDYAEEFSGINRELISSIAAEDAYLVAENFAAAVIEKQKGGGSTAGTQPDSPYPRDPADAVGVPD